MHALRHSPLLPARSLLAARLRSASQGAATAPLSRSPHSTWPAELDLSELPASVFAPDVLLLDATYLACAVAPGAAAGSSVSQRLAFLVAHLQTELQPRLTVAAFDSGARKPPALGSADARRQRTTPLSARGNPRPLAAALEALSSDSRPHSHTVACTARPVTQGDDVLAALAHALASSPLRALIVSGDSDAQSALRERRADGGGGCEWLRLARYGSAANPRPVELVTCQTFLARHGYPPSRHPLLGALLGRPRDGVPRLRGVGDRAAKSLVRLFPDVEALLAGTATSSGAQGVRPEALRVLQAAGAAEQLRRSYARCLPVLDACAPPPALVELLRESGA